MMSDIPGEGSNPTMEYYPRKYYGPTNENYTLSVKVLARDPDGIDSVIMHFADQGSSDWNHIPMTRSEGNDDLFTATLEFFYNSTELQPHETYYRQVYYVANDTLGNVAQSPIMEFGLSPTYWTWTVDFYSYLYDTPDLWYLVGSTGHQVTWATTEGGFYYTLLKDGYLLEHHFWHDELTINVDGLPLGDHFYELVVAGGFSTGRDNVTVHVVSELPFGVPSGSVGPNMNPLTNLGDGLNYLFTLCVIAIAAIVVIAVYRKFKS
ncbi:MAG: hypothetical protein ACFFFC_18005 [Candidatus Thorarchaeota archaeon]